MTEIYWNLCSKDKRHPLYQDTYGWEVDALGEEPPTPRVNCHCDNCFYGKDKLALRIIELEEQQQALVAAAVHCGKVFQSMAERGAYPQELLPWEEGTFEDSPLFLGKQGFQFLREAVCAITGWSLTEWLRQTERGK